MINVTKDFLSLDYCVRTEYFRNILLEADRLRELLTPIGPMLIINIKKNIRINSSWR